MVLVLEVMLWVIFLRQITSIEVQLKAHNKAEATMGTKLIEVDSIVAHAEANLGFKIAVKFVA